MTSNIWLKQTRTVGPRKERIGPKKQVKFTPFTSLCKRLKRITKYRESWRAQIGSGLACGINNIPDMFKYGLSKIKNKKIQWALHSDIANYVVDEVQTKIRANSSTLFD